MTTDALEVRARLEKYMSAAESVGHSAAAYREKDGTTHILEFDDLRAVLAEHERLTAVLGRGHLETLKDRDEAYAEIQRLTAPPTDTEVEALNRALTGIVEGGIDQRDAIDAIFAAGFRRQGPVTDSEVEAALDEFKALHFSWAEATAREKMRAALEAAREVIA